MHLRHVEESTLDELSRWKGANFQSDAYANPKQDSLFVGHCHLPIAGSAAGVPVSSLRGTNHAGFPVFTEQRVLSSSDLPEAYGATFIGTDYVTVHTVEFGYAGPVRIEGPPDYAAWNRETMRR